MSDDLVERAVEASLGASGMQAVAVGRRTFVVESVVMQPLWDERCMVESAEPLPEICALGPEPIQDQRALRDREAHGGQVGLRLDEPAAVPAALMDACPPLPATEHVEWILAHAFVYGAETAHEDHAYVFVVGVDGASVGCAPGGPPPEPGQSTDPELEGPVPHSSP